MFTVIMAEKSMIESFERYRLFLQPLWDSNKFALCELNLSADTIEKMVPTLYETVASHDDWRAVILTDNDRGSLNPYNFVEYKEPQRKVEYAAQELPAQEDTAEQAATSEETQTAAGDKTPKTARMKEIEENLYAFLKRRREYRFDCFEKAVDNPLVKLAKALCDFKIEVPELLSEDELAILRMPDGKEANEKYDALIADKKLDPRYCEYILEMYKCRALFENSAYTAFLPTEARDDNVNAQTDAEAEPSADVQDAPTTDKKEAVSEDEPDSLEANFRLKVALPSSVSFLRMRCYDDSLDKRRSDWKHHSALEYSRFAYFNLFAPQARFLLFDVHPSDHKRQEYDLVRFITTSILYATQPVPTECTKGGVLYRINCAFDEERLSALLSSYSAKLRLTRLKLKEMQEQQKDVCAEPLKRQEFESIFLREEPVVLHMDDDIRTEGLMADSDPIGLSGNCPEDETTFWNRQYVRIKKALQRFLKEPRRALIRAARHFHTVNKIDSEDALRLDEFQLEDIQENADEAERLLSELVTENIYDTERYYKRTDERHHEICSAAAKRMSKRTTVLLGLVVLGVYLAGFVPMLFSSLNTFGVVMVTLLFILMTCGIFALIEYLALYDLRKRFKVHFRNFNGVMHTIIGDVRKSMDSFTVYLTTANRMMRSYSVFNALEENAEKTTKLHKLLGMHIADISEVLDTHEYVFSHFIRPSASSKHTDDEDEKWYDSYDYTLDISYPYPLPHEVSHDRRIVFLQQENVVTLPVDYVKVVTLGKEEIYDD